ncbi:proline-rich protein 22-like, partial [Grus americana]|uniref:proline-rich protein 22-like n=1 Tax=Grus americana TaxID=9117 RepID=UPI002407963A
PVSPPGSATLCQLPLQQQPFPAAWAPSVWVAPQGPQALPPAGLQRAPCGCFFDPRVFHIQWTVASMPAPDSSALSHEGRAVAPAPAVLPTPIPGNQHIEGQPASQEDAGSSPTPGDTGTEGSAVAPASPVLPASIPGYRHEGQPARLTISGDLTVSEEVPLEEALRLFGCSPDTVGVSQDSPSSGPVPGELGGTGAAMPPCDFAWLSLPEELLTPDYSVPEITGAILSLEEFYGIGMEPREPWGAAGMALPPSQAAACEKRGKKRGQSALPKPASKRRA